MANNLAEHAFEAAWTRSQLELRYLGVTPQSVHRFQELLSYMLYPNARFRPSGERLSRNELNQQGLWSMGISGDLPILCVAVADETALPLVRETLAAHTYWRMQGFRADLVLLNQEGAAYDQPVRQLLLQAAQAHSLHTGLDTPGGVFLRDWHTLSEPQRHLLLAASHVVLNGARGRLARQLSALPGTVAAPVPDRRPMPAGEFPPGDLPFLELDYFNGIGGFSRTEREYCIYLDGTKTTPRPWVNVIAGPQFGTIVSESGLGHTWYGNSQSNRITPWRNDPVSDAPSEALYLRDEESGAVWSPTAQPCRDTAPYRARHGMGYTVFEHNHLGWEQELSVFVPAWRKQQGMAFDSVKICLLRVRNSSGRARTIRLFGYAEWVLGANREDSQLHVRTWLHEASGAVLAQGPWSAHYGTRVAFAGMSPQPDSYTCDRASFLGRNRHYGDPAGVRLAELDRRIGPGLDPCAALTSAQSIGPGETGVFLFLLGQGADREECARLLEYYGSAHAAFRAESSTREAWQATLSPLTVRTPVHSVNLLLNGWLLYQSLSCRFWGRSGFYQSGGAFGFRDQLQDVMALVYVDRALAREHILRSASRQYVEGDVQHWWHVETGMGVRTMCSDDLLWLPYATAHYVAVTGDAAILQERVAFISGPPLPDGHLEAMQEPQPTTDDATLLAHCLLAIGHAGRTGPHGLPLMGNGDWNDGMNLVGAGGKGESVWLAWFLIATLRIFAETLESAGRRTEAVELRGRAAALLATVERECWDGEWYLRAFFDDGSPLGSHRNTEARIDSIAQSWAVIAGGDRARGRLAVDAALRELVNPEHSMVHLFWPPFDVAEPHPGYIRGYPPGLRENGGQYTHGCLWLALACAEMGDGDQAARLLQIMNPIEANREPEHVKRYGAEPYVAPADIYAAAGQEGRAGWTWYTGSAGWMYRIWLESVLGLQLRGDTLSFHPVLPRDWPGYSLSYTHGGAHFQIDVRRAGTGETKGAFEGGSAVLDGRVHLSRPDGHYNVTVLV